MIEELLRQHKIAFQDKDLQPIDECNYRIKNDISRYSLALSMAFDDKRGNAELVNTELDNGFPRFSFSIRPIYGLTYQTATWYPNVELLDDEAIADFISYDYRSPENVAWLLARFSEYALMTIESPNMSRK